MSFAEFIKDREDEMNIFKNDMNTLAGIIGYTFHNTGKAVGPMLHKKCTGEREIERMRIRGYDYIVLLCRNGLYKVRVTKNVVDERFYPWTNDPFAWITVLQDVELSEAMDFVYDKKFEES